MCAHSKLERLSRELGEAIDHIARRTTKDGGQTPINIMRNGESAESTKRRENIHAACQILHAHALGHTRAAHHPNGTCRIGTNAVIPGYCSMRVKKGAAVIGVEIDDVLVLPVVLLNIGENFPNAAVNMTQAHAQLFQIDRQMGDAHARHCRIDRHKAIRKRHGEFCRCGELDRCLNMYWMHVAGMEKHKVIRVRQCLEYTQETLRSLIGGLKAVGGDDAFVAAVNTAVEI